MPNLNKTLFWTLGEIVMLDLLRWEGQGTQSNKQATDQYGVFTKHSNKPTGISLCMLHEIR